MRKFVVVPVLTAAVLLLGVSLARSSESDELRERAKMVKKEAAEMAKAGVARKPKSSPERPPSCSRPPSAWKASTPRGPDRKRRSCPAF